MPKKIKTIGEDHQVSLPFTAENTSNVNGNIDFVASIRLEYPEDMEIPEEMVMSLGISSPGVDPCGDEVQIISQDAHQELVSLAEGISDLLLGGEHGWEQIGAVGLLDEFRKQFRKTKAN